MGGRTKDEFAIHGREHARAGPISDGESPGKWVGCDVGERKIDGATLAYFLEQALIEIKGTSASAGGNAQSHTGSECGEKNK